MNSFQIRITAKQIKELVIGRPETYPLDLQIWIETEGFRFDPPWYLMPAQIKELHAILKEIRDKRAAGVWRASSYATHTVISYVARPRRHL